MIRIDDFPIDAALSENHSLDAEVSQWPIEKGSDTKDNNRPKLREVQIEGVVSDSPIGPIAALRKIAAHPETTLTQANIAGADALPSEDAVAVLENLWETKKIITIETTLRVYENMLMTACNIPIDKDTGEALRFSCTFRTAIFITGENSSVRVAAPVGAGNVNGGKKKALPSGYAPRSVLKDSPGIWFDPDINGFRFGAQFDGQNYHFLKGTPVGSAGDPAFGGGPGQSDSVYRTINEQELPKIDPNLPTGASTPFIDDSASGDLFHQDGTRAQNAGQQMTLPNTPIAPGDLIIDPSQLPP